ncbi:zinc finger matrin-type protein 5 isoform X2 [Ictalurus punctatus]|uniref:Zinc finger matrin-type protein 5 n=1 Tax=Ictalurus punctatus TaxID=7998 RepID=A0A2D0QBZ7_ICTPU|nr:zinc finger matrin-type protein 5 isoform X2 [Ictalurus punctatus]
MGKRYHCDYCARSFQDTLHNRKKHLNGVQHHRAKKAWFDNFRDAAAILQDERAKQGCRKFLQTGQCVFGPSCRYSHMSEQDIKDLEQHIHEERQLKVDLDQEEASAKPSLEEWLCRREKRAAPSSGRYFKSLRNINSITPGLWMYSVWISQEIVYTTLGHSTSSRHTTGIKSL